MRNKECNSHTCPWWGGYGLLVNLRKLILNHKEILREFISPGMWVLDCGCGMGFMAISAMQLCGKNGKMIIVDIQEKC